MTELLLCSDTRVILMRRLDHEVECTVGGRLPSQRTAERVVISTVYGIRNAGSSEDVIDRTVPVFPEARQAYCHLSVRDRDIDHPANFFLVVVAEGPLEVATEIVEIRLRRFDVDRAAGRVPPPQGALRAAQNLDLLGVVV